MRSIPWMDTVVSESVINHFDRLTLIKQVKSNSRVAIRGGSSSSLCPLERNEDGDSFSAKAMGRVVDCRRGQWRRQWSLYY